MVIFCLGLPSAEITTMYHHTWAEMSSETLVEALRSDSEVDPRPQDVTPTQPSLSLLLPGFGGVQGTEVGQHFYHQEGLPHRACKIPHFLGLPRSRLPAGTWSAGRHRP